LFTRHPLECPCRFTIHHPPFTIHPFSPFTRFEALVNVSPLTPIRQTAPQPVLADVAGEVRRQWPASPLATPLRPGARGAVAGGSSGITNIATVPRATLDDWRGIGAEPFVVAAMGSHGGATSEGQRQLLAEYGVSEAALGVPVKTDMDTTQVGTNSWGEPV